MSGLIKYTFGRSELLVHRSCRSRYCGFNTLVDNLPHPTTLQ